MVNSSRLLLIQGVHNALIVSLHLCKPTLLSSHQLLSFSTWPLSCQHWDPDKFQSHALNTIDMLISPKFTSLALTSHLDFGLTANSLLSNRYVKLYTFETALGFLRPYSSSLYMTTHPFWFSCPKPRSQPHFLCFPQHPLQSIHLYIGLLSDLLAVPPKHILSPSTSFHPSPSHFTFLPCPSSPKLRRETQTPCASPNAHLSDLIF